ILFKLTATSTMNAFYVPDLAGMIYAMPGMQTELNAVINKPGVFPGMATHYSGSGFSGMTFKFHGLSQDGFDQWVQKAKTEGKALDKSTYLNLAQPSERDPVQRFASVEEGLYDKVLNRCVEDGKMCMHHMMAIDERGGEAFVKAQGLNLPQDVCTVDNASQVVASLAARHISRAPTAQ
ncbi:MAG TPA: COX aromatic rich motif-containing protein, partial [Acidovorax temperans]|nr:COX aromatic rich motif-containing protein [Acidovorax temperans]